MEVDTLYDPTKPYNQVMERTSDSMEIDTPNEEVVTVVVGSAPKKTVRFEGANEDVPMVESFNISGNVQINRAIQLALKKKKKKGRKTGKNIY
jgi:hypothetical protein